jgi:hypothetical protein
MDGYLKKIHKHTYLHHQSTYLDDQKPPQEVAPYLDHPRSPPRHRGTTKSPAASAAIPALPLPKRSGHLHHHHGEVIQSTTASIMAHVPNRIRGRNIDTLSRNQAMRMDPKANSPIPVDQQWSNCPTILACSIIPQVKRSPANTLSSNRSWPLLIRWVVSDPYTRTIITAIQQCARASIDDMLTTIPDIKFCPKQYLRPIVMSKVPLGSTGSAGRGIPRNGSPVKKYISSTAVKGICSPCTRKQWSSGLHI